ncbi:C2H2-type zinc finger protein [Halobellus captivus]|uniref:C2H2-type zinc finger protein n=1 Tax=Halobellus captivus TaxID=2592614 RepID=UPI001EF052CE|nr:C2H2-type zinc finger protein [Halobellus captivus]
MTDVQSDPSRRSERDTAETPTYACDDCGRRFYTQDLLVLHRGVAHPSALDEGERDAYREAYAAEERAIRSFRIRALGILVLLYFGFLLLYVFYAS